MGERVMSEIHLSATAGPDGVLHLDVPVGSPGEFEVHVRVVPKPAVNGPGRAQTPEERGWPPGYFEKVVGSITDESFVAPPRGPSRPVPPLDAE
jgi:hypothetical protein